MIITTGGKIPASSLAQRTALWGQSARETHRADWPGVPVGKGWTGIVRMHVEWVVIPCYRKPTVKAVPYWLRLLWCWEMYALIHCSLPANTVMSYHPVCGMRCIVIQWLAACVCTFVYDMHFYTYLSTLQVVLWNTVKHFMCGVNLCTAAVLTETENRILGWFIVVVSVMREREREREREWRGGGGGSSRSW